MAARRATTASCTCTSRSHSWERIANTFFQLWKRETHYWGEKEEKKEDEKTLTHLHKTQRYRRQRKTNSERDLTNSQSFGLSARNHLFMLVRSRDKIWETKRNGNCKLAGAPSTRKKAYLASCWTVFDRQVCKFCSMEFRLIFSPEN